VKLVEVNRETLGNYKGVKTKSAMIYWKHPSNFSVVEQAFGTLFGKVSKNLDLVPISNWREFSTVYKNYDKIYMVTNTNLLNSAVLNDVEDKVVALINTEGLQISHGLAEEIKVYRNTVANFVAENPDIPVLVSSESIEGYMKTKDIENKIFYNQNNFKGIIRNTSVALLYTPDVNSIKSDMFKMLFTGRNHFIIVPPKDSQEKETKVEEMTIESMFE
jgi:hypothetical protein